MTVTAVHMWYVVHAYLQLLLQQCDLSDACLSGLIGLLHLPPLSRQTESYVLQFTLQLGLLVILLEGDGEGNIMSLMPLSVSCTEKLLNMTTPYSLFSTVFLST